MEVENMMRNIRVSVLLFDGDKLLVVNMKRPNSNIFVLAGGGLEHKESIFDAGIREVKEETNLDVVILKIAYIKELYTDTDESLDIILLGNIVGGELKKGFDPEHGNNQILHDVQWVDIHKIASLPFHPKQLINRLHVDFANNFVGGTKHLGRFKYPEDGH
jgi:8-oxo-dGTP pyrophosphatase MutT (NUDIX family)